jgi:hypothetical protein
MPHTVFLRPHHVAAARSPFFYIIGTDRARLSSGYKPLYVLRINAAPPDGAGFLWDGFSFYFKTPAGGLDPYNPYHISLAGSPTPLTLAQRVQQALQQNVNLLDVFQNMSYTSFASGYAEAYARAVAAAPTTPPNYAFDPAGSAYTDQQNDPLFTSLSAGQTGSKPARRPGYRFLLQPFLEEGYRGSATFVRLPRLSQPALYPQDGDQQIFTFRLDALYAPHLGFDVPDPALSGPFLAQACFRRAYALYGDRYEQGTESGQLFEDEQAGSPYRFFVLAARGDRWALLPHGAEDAAGCAQDSYAEVSQADVLAPYFAHSPEAPQRWLCPYGQQRWRPGQPAYLACYVNPAVRGWTDLATVQAILSSPEGPAQQLSGFFGAYQDCYDTGAQEQLMIVPVHELLASASLGSLETLYLSLAPAAGFPAANNGTFEDGQDEGVDFAAVPPAPTAGGPLFGAGADPAAARSGSYGGVIQSNEDFSGFQTFLLNLTGPLRLQPYTSYTITGWVWVTPNTDAAQGETLHFTHAGFADASFEILQSYAYATQARGQWYELKARLHLGAALQGRLQLAPGQIVRVGDGREHFYLDDLQMTPGPPLLWPYRYELDHGCEPLQTLVYQNALGVPATLSLQGGRRPDRRLALERATARSTPARSPGAAPEAFEQRHYNTQARRSWTFRTLPLAEWERAQAQDAAQSEHLFLWEAAPQQPAHTPGRAEAAAARLTPVLLDKQALDLAANGDARWQMTLELRESRAE